ncbi:hypothetical protein SODALDRAFT_142997 [Sodiomyces alkalinus F11]|uniref:Uncharacterized protein n=1 Tax=Sodiomyces alkalinus (strain CBS 110278 / VKM F-3762 / F11) TaxID=1314773 RepID=A0A3N2Q050_SODAK|nr:hypothetical protein SODALDRAFT_142997 [Sodiomyces alkalinus F11]ROT39985.1 hypothetical protein SODALDRAFT_142997 [Sodiomyces alkalinus F11]
MLANTGNPFIQTIYGSGQAYGQLLEKSVVHSVPGLLRGSGFVARVSSRRYVWSGRLALKITHGMMSDRRNWCGCLLSKAFSSPSVSSLHLKMMFIDSQHGASTGHCGDSIARDYWPFPLSLSLSLSLSTFILSLSCAFNCSVTALAYVHDAAAVRSASVPYPRVRST